MSKQRPLEGIRVISQAIVWAGPAASIVLGELGADCIEIESIQHLTRTRTSMRHPTPEIMQGSFGTAYVNRDSSEGFWNRQSNFNYAKRSHRSVTLNLDSERGRELFYELAKVSDIFIENNAAGVVGKLGIDYETLSAINPRLIMARFPAFGTTGPYRDFKGFAPTMEAVGGHTALRGYRDSDPSMTPGLSHGDPNAGVHVAFAVQAALIARERTGRGQLIDLSHAEAAVHHMAYFFMDYSMNRRVHGHPGNRHPSKAPSGVFPCARAEDDEDERWIAIAIDTDEQFATLCEQMGRPELAQDERFAEVPARHAHQDELEPIIAEWTRELDQRELTDRLQAVGVPAMLVARQDELLLDPHLEERGFWVEVTHPEAGTHRYPARIARFERVPIENTTPAPTLGQHNHEILVDLLRVSEQEYGQLVEDEQIGTVYLDTAT